MFGNINLQTKEGSPESGRGNFRMCIVDSETGEPMKVEKFSWTIYDLDQRSRPLSAGQGTRLTSIKERMIIDLSQVAGYHLWPDATQSKVSTSCEDGSPLPCHAGTRTVFHSSEWGQASDNPSDPNDMTELQME